MGNLGSQIIRLLIPTVIVATGLTVLSAGRVWAGSVPPVRSERELPEGLLTKPVVIYNRPYTAAVYSDYVPSKDEAESPFVMAMAGNEYEPIQVGLYVPSDKATLQDVSLQVKCDIPSQIGRIHYTPLREHRWAGAEDKPRPKGGWVWPVDRKLLVGRRVHMPTFVIPRPDIEAIEPGRSGAFWITFKTDEKISPGSYPGTFIIRAKGQRPERIAFTVKVYLFMLPRPKIHYGMYYRHEHHEQVPYQSPGFTRMYFEDMAAHGMNTMHWEQLGGRLRVFTEEGYDRRRSSPLENPDTRLVVEDYFESEDYEPDGGYNAYKLVDKMVHMSREAGLLQRDHPLVSYCTWNGSSRYKAQAVRLLADQDWPYFILYTKDEPHALRDFPAVSEHVREWRRIGAVTSTASGGESTWVFGDVHSVWICLSGRFITPELQREAERLGAEVWTYDYNLRITNAEANRFYSGLYMWSVGLKGNVAFTYIWDEPRDCVFDSDWKLSSPHSLGYIAPSPIGPVPGVGWEGRREGVDDVRYLQLLEARVAAARQNDATAQEARTWLSEVRKRSYSPEFDTNRYNAMGTDYMDPNSQIAPGDYDAIRAKAADFIMKLAPAAGEQNPQPSQWVRLQGEPLEADAYADASITECLEAVKSGSAKQKRQAAAALALRQAKEILPARELLAGLLDDPEVRLVALRPLARMGPEAASAIRHIRKLLDSEDRFVQGAAIWTLARIGPAAAEVLAAFARDEPDADYTSLHIVVRETLDWIEKNREK